MNCPEIKAELVHYARGECEPELAEQIDRHLAECADCRETGQALTATLRVLRQELAPVEPSARLRAGLRERLDAATRLTDQLRLAEGSARSEVAAAPATPATAPRRGSGRLMGRLRRSPFLAASLALHAVALGILALLILRPVPEPVRVVVENDPVQPAAPGSAEYYDYLALRAAPRLAKIGRPDPAGLKVDVTEFATTGRLVFAPHPAGNRLVAFLDDRPGTPGAEVLAGRADARRGEIASGQAVIPTIFEKLFSPGWELLVFHLDNRLEFWARDKWNAYEKQFVASAPAAGRVLPDLAGLPLTAWAELRRSRNRI